MRSWCRSYSSARSRLRNERTRCAWACAAGESRWLGHLDRLELVDAEDLGEPLDREQVRLARPLHVGHVVGRGRRRRERGVEDQLVRQREHEVVVHDRLEVDRRAGALRVLVVERVHVAEAEHGVAHAERGEIHHRITQMTELEVEDRGDVPILVVELSGVPHDRGLAALRVDRVAVDPPQTELEEGVGPHLGGAVPGYVHVEADPSGPARCRGPCDAGARVRLGVELVDPGEDPHVLVHDTGALLVGRRVEVVLARHHVDHEGARFVDPAVDVRDRDAVGLEQLLERHLVLEREEGRRVGAVAPHHDRRLLAVAVDVDEPHRPPPGLLADPDDGPARVLAEPLGDLVVGAVHGHPRVILRPMISFMISVVPP